MGYLKSDQSAYSQTSLYDRVKKLLVSFEWSDCSFSVFGKSIKAHKLILGISSPVFEAMFYGPLSTDKDIVITDIQPDVFQLIINYIYTDSAEISTIEEAFDLLYASRKYMLEDLTEKCIEYIQGNLSVDNVVEVLNYPDYMQDKQLTSFALKLFCEHANYLLQEKKSFITSSCMKTILGSDEMNVLEKNLIQHVFEWTSHCCRQNNIPDTIENRRDILDHTELFKLLRFLTLTLDDLEEIYTDSNNLLQTSEYGNLQEQIKSGIKTCENNLFSSVKIPRNFIKIDSHLCYRSPIRSVAPIIIDANHFTVHSRIKSNKSLFINSLCVPTRMAPAVHFRNNIAKVYSEQLSVSISCESENSFVKLTNFMNTVEYDSMVNIELTEPCFIKKDEWYKITFVWPSNRSASYSYLVEFRERQYTGHKVVFEFDDLPFNTGKGGSFLGGLKFCL